MSVEKKLEKICKGLIKFWDERQNETQPQKASCEAFSRCHDMEPDKLEEFYQAREKDLESVVAIIPGTHGEKYQPAEMVDGFVAWNKYLSQSDPSVPTNKTWTRWILKQMDEENDYYEMFIGNTF